MPSYVPQFVPVEEDNEESSPTEIIEFEQRPPMPDMEAGDDDEKIRFALEHMTGEEVHHPSAVKIEPEGEASIEEKKGSDP
mmetsp:Transcript_5128/g.7837  ORF Transcript_5128/g.7837 Transcript_5128/m.7837 type:complete len:81 (-) Transcript_5128:2092-2334(-)